MADKKISQLTSATTPLAGTEVLPIVQGSTTVKVSVDNLTSNKAVSVGTLTSNGLVTVNSSTVDPYWSSQLQLIGNATYNPKQILWSTHGYRWSIRNNDVGGAGEFVIRYEEGAVDAVSIDRLANTTFTGGNLIQGTAAKGVNFTANTPAAGMTSQLLNWYEEGAWTPGSGVGTATGNSAQYVRIGRQVTIIGSLTFPVQINAGQATITGLPFAMNANGGAAFLKYTDYGSVVFMFGNASTTTIGFYSTAGVGLTYTNVSGKRFDFVGTYFV